MPCARAEGCPAGARYTKRIGAGGEREKPMRERLDGGKKKVYNQSTCDKSKQPHAGIAQSVEQLIRNQQVEAWPKSRKPA